MGDNQFSRTPVYASLVLAVVLVVGVLVGARVVFDRAGNQPVVLSELPAEHADSPECAALLDALPEKIGRFERAELADPAPAGAAAWAKNSNDRITLRCGVDAPAQWVDGAQTTTVDGVEWLPVSDPDTDMTTWYTVDRSAVVAVTATGEDPTEKLAEAVAQMPEEATPKHPLPLADAATPEAGKCAELTGALPQQLGDYSLAGVEGAKAHWSAPGAAPVTMACGVEMPESYRPGEQVTQIDGVTWFREGEAFFALGRDAVVAVAAPPTATEQVLVPLSAAVDEHVRAR